MASDCTFYDKLGVCRHGDNCPRVHNKRKSCTLILKHFYLVPLKVKDEDKYYTRFYKDVLNELMKYGDIEQLCVCVNKGDHLVCYT